MLISISTLQYRISAPKSTCTYQLLFFILDPSPLAMQHSSGSVWHLLGTASDDDKNVDGSGSSSGVELRLSSTASSVANGFIVVHGDGGPSMGAGMSNGMCRQDGNKREEGIGGEILAMGSESDFRALTRRLHSEENKPVGGLDGGY